MIRNQAGQVITANLVRRTAPDPGSAITSGTVTVYVLGDGGTRVAGTGTIEYEGGGTWSYWPKKAETNYAVVTYSFVHADAITVDVQVATTISGAPPESPVPLPPADNSPLAKINESMAAAVAAQKAGNYSVALTQVESAWMLLTALPDSELDGERLEWSRDGMRELMEWLQKRKTATATAADGSRGAIIRPADVYYRRG